MLESNMRVINKDVNTLVKDAQDLFQAASALTGEKADELRKRGMKAPDSALVRVEDAQACALAGGKQMAASADGYVRENPWRMIATAAGVGLLAGVVLGRR